MSTYLYAFENPDKHGIDEDDAHTIVRLLLKAYPNVQFSCGFVEGVLGIRVESFQGLGPRAAAIDTYRAFTEGAIATRPMWER